MKLQIKIFISILIIAIVPLVLTSAVTYDRYTEITTQRADDISINMFSTAVSNLNSTIDSIKKTAGIFTFYSDSNFSIIESLKEFSTKGKKIEPYEIVKANQNIKFICQNILYSYDYISGIYVFTPSGIVLGYNNGFNGDVSVDYNPQNHPWYQNTLLLDGSLYVSTINDFEMFSGKKKSIFFAQSLYDIYSHKFLGVLVIDCNPELFNIDQTNIMSEITLFTLKNELSDSVLYTNSQFLNKNFSTKNSKNLDTALAIDSLHLTATVDYDALYREFNLTGILITMITLICGFAIMVISFLISKKITQPIEHLSKKMSHQNSRSLSISSRYLNRVDEIGTLYNEYNNMIEELNNSIRKDYQTKLIALDAQMQSLEANINSHFLFNTLESINSMAEIEESKQIAAMSLALGNMFRYSIKTPSELVMVSDELNHVMDYISIQSIRFDNKFHMDIQIPNDILDLKMLKLILQPLVENSFYHGLNYCTVGDTISISGKKDDSFLYLYISDNGQGMSVENCSKLQAELLKEASFKELGHRTKQSIGLKNIQTRIELYYGRGYGLSIYSELNKGTQIQVKIPVLEMGGK